MLQQLAHAEKPTAPAELCTAITENLRAEDFTDLRISLARAQAAEAVRGPQEEWLGACGPGLTCEFPHMHTVTLEHARIHFDSLVKEAAGGEEIVIESGHNALVRLLPAVPTSPRRQALAEWLERARQRPAPHGLTTDGVLKETRSEI